MSEELQPTQETDARSCIDNLVCSDFARRLERERDQARRELARLRDALDNANEKIRAFAKPAVQNLLAKMSTPSPDHKDTERLDWLLEYITQNGSDGIQALPWTNLTPDELMEDRIELAFDRASIDAEIERTKIQ